MFTAAILLALLGPGSMESDADARPRNAVDSMTSAETPPGPIADRPARLSMTHTNVAPSRFELYVVPLSAATRVVSRDVPFPILARAHPVGMSLHSRLCVWLT